VRQARGFALVTLKKPLIFNHEDNDPVDILITMAAVDATTHQEGQPRRDNKIGAMLSDAIEDRLVVTRFHYVGGHQQLEVIKAHFPQDVK
jgi:hypothetical protein